VRRIPRKSLAMAGALVVAFGVTGTAWGDGASDNTSQVSASINPPVLPASGAAKKGNLFTQVTTYDNNNDNGCTPGPTCFPPIPDQAAEVVTIDFPNDMKYTVNSKLAKCNIANIGGDTTAAVNACKSSVIGGGNAYARIPGIPTTNNEVELTVTAFNGQTSTAGGGFTGGFPTILLHADNASLPTTLVTGEVRNSSAGADFGRQLNVPDAPDVAGDTGALVLFNSQVAKSWTNGKTGNKKKTYNLVTSNCDAGDLDFRGNWTYDDASTDTDTVSQDCVN
jgi:hypothetical protein